MDNPYDCGVCGMRNTTDCPACQYHDRLHKQVERLKAERRYTGCKDRNGRKLYEGDKVRFLVRAWDEWGMGDHYEEGVIELVNGTFTHAAAEYVEALGESRMDKFIFNCNSNNAPAYSCNKPGDSSGEFYRVEDADALIAQLRQQVERLEAKWALVFDGHTVYSHCTPGTSAESVSDVLDGLGAAAKALEGEQDG